MQFFLNKDNKFSESATKILRENWQKTSKNLDSNLSNKIILIPEKKNFFHFLQNNPQLLICQIFSFAIRENDNILFDAMKKKGK